MLIFLAGVGVGALLMLVSLSLVYMSGREDPESEFEDWGPPPEQP